MFGKESEKIQYSQPTYNPVGNPLNSSLIDWLPFPHNYCFKILGTAPTNALPVFSFMAKTCRGKKQKSKSIGQEN